MRPPPFLVDTDAPPAKAAIIEAALRLFTTRGLSSTSIRDIADEAGFTNPALYRHFEGKEALAVHIFEASYRWLATRASAATDEEKSGRAKLRAFAGAMALAYAESPEAVLFVNDNLRELWPRTHGRLAGLSLVRQVRELVREARGARASLVSDELAAVAVLGLFSQWARAVHFEALAGPPARWSAELALVVEKIVLG